MSGASFLRAKTSLLSLSLLSLLTHCEAITESSLAPCEEGPFEGPRPETYTGLQKVCKAANALNADPEHSLVIGEWGLGLVLISTNPQTP